MYIVDVLERLNFSSRVEVLVEGWDKIADLVVGVGVNVGANSLIELYFRDDEKRGVKVVEFFRRWKEGGGAYDVFLWVDDVRCICFRKCKVECVLVPYALSEEFQVFNRVGQNIVLRYKSCEFVKKEKNRELYNL
jgi:hypothetical protein